MNAAKLVLIAVGVFHLTMCSMGSIGLVDYHVCIKDAGECDKQEQK